MQYLIISFPFEGQMRDKFTHNITKYQQTKRLQNCLFNRFTAYYIVLVIVIYAGYFPIQNFVKIFSSKSSVVTVPVISPR